MSSSCPPKYMLWCVIKDEFMLHSLFWVKALIESPWSFLIFAKCMGIWGLWNFYCVKEIQTEERMVEIHSCKLLFFRKPGWTVQVQAWEADYSLVEPPKNIMQFRKYVRMPLGVCLLINLTNVTIIYIVRRVR